MSRPDWVHGSSIDKKTGKIRYLSASQMNTAESCMRKWHWEKVSGKKPPDTEATTLGTESHAQIEHYLETGQKTFGPIVMAGAFAIPEPGPDLLIEHDLLARLDQPGLVITEKNSQFLLDNAPLRAGGVPVLGFIDLIHFRCTNKGGSDVEQTRDPEGTVEVLDWKTTSDFKWATKGKNLIETVQMSGYGKWVLNQKPDVTRVRLSHVYFRTRGAPAARKETHLFHPEEIHTAWEHADGIARLMQTAATEPDSNKVDFNLDACSDYGGCIHRRYCTAGMDVGVAALIGRTQARKLEKAQGIAKPMGSLLSMANKKKAETGIDPVALEVEKAKLVAQEKEAEIANRIPEGFREVVAQVEALNVGFPKLTGKAARAYMALANKDVPEDYVVPGFGEYGYVHIEECQTMHELYEELKSLPPKEETETSPLPPDAPESNPEIAAMDTEGNHIQAPTPPKPQAVDAVVAAVKKEPKKKEPKVEKTHEVVPATITVPIQIEMSGDINLYINCIPSVPYTDLYTWCNQVADDMAANFPGTDKQGNQVATVDIRCAPNDTGIGYGKWEGLLSAVARSEEHSPLAPGNYYIDTHGSRIREVIADALKSRATRYAVGVR